MKDRQKWTRVLALILAILLVGGTVLSVLVSAFAEEAAPERDQCSLQMEYLEEEQALHITQRLVYHNRTGDALDRVVFYAAANMFRRETALMYEPSALADVFPAGYTPSGLDILRVQRDGQEANWGFQDENEMILRVSCDLAPGESCTFEFEYYLLLSVNRAMIGLDDIDVRLSAFPLIPCRYEDGAFRATSPVQFTDWLDTDSADYDGTLTLPDKYALAATGEEILVSIQDHAATWSIQAENVRSFALSFGKRWRESVQTTASGVTVRVLSNHRLGSARALSAAVDVIEAYESWLGEFPVKQIDLVQTGYPVDILSHPGTIWIPDSLWGDENQLKKKLAFALAKQYIGLTAYPQPLSDAWLSDVPCAYLALLTIEELDGRDAFLAALNDQVLDALRITLPGGLYVTADATLFTADEYELIVRDRGCVVMHELRTAMGRDEWIAGMRRFYVMGLETDILGEMDLVAALDEVTGGDWEDFLTDWLFNVDDYVEQGLDYYE